MEHSYCLSACSSDIFALCTTCMPTTFIRRGRPTQVPLLRRPPPICQHRIMCQLLPPHHVRLLFSNGRRVVSRLPQPLVPLRTNLNVGHVGTVTVMNDAPRSRIGGELVQELPVGVALEVLTYCMYVSWDREEERIWRRVETDR